jgi:hypothetical protein
MLPLTVSVPPARVTLDIRLLLLDPLPIVRSPEMTTAPDPMLKLLVPVDPADNWLMMVFPFTVKLTPEERLNVDCEEPCKIVSVEQLLLLLMV